MMGDVDDLSIAVDRATVATRVGDCLLVTAPSDLGGQHLKQLEEVTLTAINASPTRSVVFQLAGVQFMDGYEFTVLQNIAKMAEHLGAKVVFVGLRPGIVAHLVNLDIHLTGVPTALGLDEAFALLAASKNDK